MSEINLKKSPSKFLDNYKQKEIDSLEEVYFIWYLQELHQKGFVDKVLYHDTTLKLSNGLFIHTYDKPKTKIKKRHRQLIKPHEYSWDFDIIWNISAKYIMTNPISGAKHDPSIPFVGGMSYIEVKGNFDRNNMTRLFRINQKWVWEQHLMYIQLIKIPLLFKQTFVPERYLLTNFTKKQRKIDFKKTTSDSFLKRYSTK